MAKGDAQMGLAMKAAASPRPDPCRLTSSEIRGDRSCVFPIASRDCFSLAPARRAAYGGWLLPPVPGQPVGLNVFPLVIGTGLHFADSRSRSVSARRGRGIIPVEGGRPRAARQALRPARPAAVGALLFYVAVADRLGFIITAALIVLDVTALGARWSFRCRSCAGAYRHPSDFLSCARALPIGLLPMW
jgi:putative tricarboxylic transport membrane protein